MTESEHHFAGAGKPITGGKGAVQAAQDEALLRQALEALEFSDWYTRAKAKSTITALRERLAETADDLTRCPNCGGPADNGHDREVPPTPYWCSKCTES